MGRIVTLRIYPNVEDAELAHQFLAENNIQTTLQMDDIGGMHPSSNFTVGVKLLIDENDLEKAQDLLQLVK